MKINRLENDNYEVTFEKDETFLMTDNYKVTFKKDETFLMTLDEVVQLLRVPVRQIPHVKTEQELFDEFWESDPVYPKE